MNNMYVENKCDYQDNTEYDGNGHFDGRVNSPRGEYYDQQHSQAKMRNFQSDESIQPVNCDELMHITSFNDLKGYAAGTIVRFPDFAEGQPFVARVRRPSMLVLAKSGKIPNTLLTAAGSLFTGAEGGMNAKDPKMLGEVHDVCEVICEAALIQPTLSEIYSAGMELSDDQLMAIFSYTQTGVKALESFRKK